MTEQHKPFLREARPPDAAGVVTWVHIGDLHMKSAGEQNHADLLAIVDRINRQFASSVSFVFLPGDNADDGSAGAYALVRDALDRLQVPWHAIVGDHDVHEKSLGNFLRFLEPATHYGFAAGPIHFLALNAFDLPDPKSFALLEEQLRWLEGELAWLGPDRSAVLLLHCYPTDLKQGSERLRQLVEGPRVLLIDMGHTHYNEVANDGKTLYTATRSTGQIEEGAVGFSVTNIDAGAVSWKFLELDAEALAMITFPADERFLTCFSRAAMREGRRCVRVKTWGPGPFEEVAASVAHHTVTLEPVGNSHVWQGLLPEELPDGLYELEVRAVTRDRAEARDRIQMRIGEPDAEQERAARDQDNALEAWPERGLLGTQLGPNKNGKKW